jgi:predicted nucleotidyltransferase
MLHVGEREGLSLQAHARRRDALRQRIEDTLSSDLRIAAAWLGGSFGRGEADAWSDLDVAVAIRDAHVGAFLDERPALYRRLGVPLLVHHAPQSNAPHGGDAQRIIFDGPLEVDFAVSPLSTARLPAHAVVLFAREHIPTEEPALPTAEERRQACEARLSFIWAMAPTAIRYAGRLETARAAAMISLMTDAYIRLWRLVHTPSAPVLPNQPLEAALDSLLPLQAPAIDPLVCLRGVRQLCAQTEMMHPELAAIGVAVPWELPEQVEGLASLAQQTVYTPR